jgi:hypothetical protein
VVKNSSGNVILIPMTSRVKIILSKRFKSFLWRSGNIFAIGFLAFVSENIGLLELPPVVVVLVGLATAELTKYLNTPKMITGDDFTVTLGDSL